MHLKTQWSYWRSCDDCRSRPCSSCTSAP